MSASDVEIDEQLVEAGSKLVDPPASVDELLALLDQVESCLAKVDQSPSKYMQEVLSVPLKALVGDRLFKHSDIDVRVAVASCMSEITRISAPEAPYEDDKMKEVFQLIVSSFKNLSDKSAQSYGKRCAILETAAKVRSCVLMLDLECDALILEMFHLFLKEIRDYHPESVFTAMETIMALVIEESEDVSPELLSSILETVKRDNEEVQPIVKKLGETILESCASKLKPYLSQLLKSSCVSSNDYSSVVSSICQGTIEGTEQNETCGLKLDEPTEEVTTLQQVDAAPDVSPESVISNSEEKEEKDSSLADSASVKKECGDDSNAAEKTKLSSTVELHKSVEKMEPQQDQTFERKGSNPKSSTEQVESADNKEKGVENDISTVASKKQSDEESLKEVVVEPSSSDADGKERQKDASPPYTREEDQKKKGGAEEKKEHMIKDVKEVAGEISEEKRSEDVVEKGNDGEDEKSSRADMDIDGTSDSVVKPLKKHNEEALYSKEASVEMGGDEVETPTVEADKISDKKFNSGQVDNAIDATSDSEAKSLKQHKEEALSSIIGDGISTMQPENKKGQINTSVKKGADNVTSDEKPSKIDEVIDANSDSEAKSAKQWKKEAVSSRSGAGISTRKLQHKKGQPEGRKDSEKQAKASVEKDVDKIVSDEKTNQAEMDIDATSDSEAKFSKQRKKEASISSKKYPEDKKGHVKGRMISEKQVKTSSKKDIGKVIPDEKPSKADKDTDGTSDSETKSLKQRKKEGLSSSSGIAKRKPEAKITQDKGRTVSEKQIKTSVKKDVDQIISDEKPSKDIDATSDSEAKSLKQRKKEPVSSSRQAEGKKGQAKGKMVSEKQIKASTKKDVHKVLSDEEPSQDKDIDATSDSEAKPLRLRKKEASSSSGGISKRQQEDKKEQAKGKIVSEKPGKTSATKDLDKDKEVVSSSRTGNKRARDETHIDRSKKSTPAKEEKSNKKEFGKELVGSRIKVWWPLDKAYYEGKVSSFDPVKKKHKVSYVDGDIETLQLKDEKWKLVTDDSESDQEDQSEDEESLGASPERTPMKKGRTNLNSSSGKKEKIEASSKKSGVATSSGKSKEAAPTSGGKNQRSKNGTKIAKSKENEVGTSKGSARSKQEISRTAKRKQEDDDDDDLPPTPKSKTPEVSGKSNTNGSGKAKSASKTLGDTKSLPEKKRRRVQ